TLFCLACSDLVVGVSNDAVNFLNSATGSKAAPLYVVLIIASIGILLGATFSSGMMEVARSGIFYPARFYFSEVMLIFLAVVISDVILLDLFNTFGLPTSTTVSMVFELLGASIAISVIKIYHNAGETLAQLPSYINTSKASAIVFSILASVFIGFIFGMTVQFLARCLFSFKTKRTIRYFGAVWGGICIALIAYFLVFKAMKDSTLLRPEWVEYLGQHTSEFLGLTFAGSGLILWAVQLIFKYNPLRVIVLAGTFALAMAFAGNDLVNFIGVSMAGLSSFEIFQQAGGVAPDQLTMGALAGQDAPTATIFLFMAGVIMACALWFSKKAKTVLKTTVNLSSQNSEEERFASTPLSRSVVKMFVGMSEAIDHILPAAFKKAISKRFKPAKEQEEGLAFDLVRASVNLMVAASLIAFGTSLKLPLSTTYITFMVAMGTSLSDGAWGRENAVYRVTGVFTVIAGWFMTALVALLLAFCISSLFHFGGVFAIIPVLALVIFLMLRSRIISKRKEMQKQEQSGYLYGQWTEDEGLVGNINKEMIGLLERIPPLYDEVLNGLEAEDLRQLRNTKRTFQELDAHTQFMKNKFNDTLNLLQGVAGAAFYVQTVNYLREILHSTSFLIDASYEHTDNRHKPMQPEQIAELRSGSKALHDLFDHLIFIIRNGNYAQLEALNAEHLKVTALFDLLDKKQIK
ncbi:MAG: inorganic phosphate transporter, partial [Bacteroidales bacterium]|nr:inorganic phosphate transporter [Bacteroidales bacterium]